jgi:AraC-like DNA-binding protein
VPIDVQEFSTDDPELAHAVLNQAYGFEHPVTVSGSADDFDFQLWHASAGDVGAGHVRHGMSARMIVPPAGFLLVDTVIDGTFDELTVGGRTFRGRRGDPLLISHDSELIGRWTDIEIASLQIPMALVQRVVRERTDLRSDSVFFVGVLPVSPAAAKRWRALTSFVQREIAVPDSMLEEPLILGQITELIATTALTTFGNSAMGIDGSGRRVALASPSLRRAVAYIEDNAHRPISISDIADAAGVSPRALQYGFRRHLDSSPNAYLRRVRLEYAHRELQHADPIVGVTVAQVARRWGFANAGRFATLYRGAYGCSPRQTLSGS